ncbi:MAG: hypothetical protein ACXW5U_09075 [Thermoanaerobaculia bacterium]
MRPQACFDAPDPALIELPDIDTGGFMSRTIIGVLMLVAVLLPAVETQALPAPLCGFECNIQGLDICVHTGDYTYRCWQIYGGCISGPHSACLDSRAL